MQHYIVDNRNQKFPPSGGKPFNFLKEQQSEQPV